MEIRFAAPDLRRLDELRSEALVLGVFADERPASGPLGLVDWRLCGVVSRLLLGGRLKGDTGERLLLPSRGRLPFDKLVVFGLGRRRDFDEEAFDAATRDILATLAGVRIRAPAVSLPGRPLDLIPPDRAMERFLDLLQKADEHDEITLVEDAEAQKVMIPLMEQAKRRARADVT